MFFTMTHTATAKRGGVYWKTATQFENHGRIVLQKFEVVCEDRGPQGSY